MIFLGSLTWHIQPADPILVYQRESGWKEKRLLHSIPGRREEERSKKEKSKKKILLLDEKINKPRTRMTKMSQCRNIDSTSWIICGMCGALQNTRSPFHCERLLWGVADDGFLAGLNSSVCWEERAGGGSAEALIPLQSQAAAFSWPTPCTSWVLCGASGARNNSHVKSHFRIQQSYLCPARFQVQWKKGMNRWTKLLVPFLSGESVELFCPCMSVFHALILLVLR